MMHELPLPSHEEYEKGGVLIAVPYQRDIPQAKTTIYVQAIIHRKKMKETGATDILYHWDGIVRETSRANIFFVDQKRRIHTPDKDVLSGVTRKQVLGLIKGNYELICRDIHMDELPDMEEAFITSSTKSVFPIVLIENTRIGNGIPGPIAKDIESMYQNAIRTYIDNKVPV
jgi:branched-subunit amino acid aminotransferase/4-amino-4-deoxychorismate lyase